MANRQIGTKSYWEETYQQELENLDAFGDEGEVWFGDQVLKVLLDWIEEHVRQLKKDPLETSVWDVGCGNGHLLIELHQRGFLKLLGTDYSPNAIAVSERIVQQRAIDNIRFEIDDVLDSHLTERFDVIIDKGTYDAISLSKDAEKHREIYAASIANRMTLDGLFIVTSCNFTIEELTACFKRQFDFFDVVKNYPSYEFGGRTGATVSTLAFKLKTP